MISKGKKNKKSSRWEIISPIFLVLLIILGIAFLVVSNLRISQRRQELISQIAKLEEEIKAQEKQNAELQAGVSQVLDQNYLEQEAREKLGLKKPGEEVVLVQQVETEETKTEQKKEETKNPWNPKNWWDWIKNKLRD
jgi:cell division protein FtsL